jgi:hypothetical protein
MKEHRKMLKRKRWERQQAEKEGTKEVEQVPKKAKKDTKAPVKKADKKKTTAA